MRLRAHAGLVLPRERRRPQVGARLMLDLDLASVDSACGLTVRDPGLRTSENTGLVDYRPPSPPPPGGTVAVPPGSVGRRGADRTGCKVESLSRGGHALAQ